MPKTYLHARRQFLIMSGLWACFFATGNWLFFTRQFMTNGQIGIFDAVCFTVGLLMEIPSGSIADRWGRRKTLIIGSIMMGLGYGGMGFSQHAWHIYVGYLVYIVGSSLFSGADDALMYDYMKSENLDSHWGKLQREKTIVKRICSVLSTLLGGPLYALKAGLPMIMRGVFFLLMLIPVFKLKYADQKREQAVHRESYFRHLQEGIKTLANKRMIPLLLLIVFISGIGNTFFIGGVLRPFILERSGLSVSWHPFVISLAGLFSLVILFKQPDIKRQKLFPQALLIGLLMVVGFAVNIPKTYLLLMVAGSILIHIASYLLQPIISELVNLEATSEHRATTISTANLFDQLGYIVAAPLIGVMVSSQKLGLFIGGLTTVMLASLLISYYIHSATRQSAPGTDR